MTRDEIRSQFERRPFVPLFIKLIGDDGSCYEVTEPGYGLRERYLVFFQGDGEEWTMRVRIKHLDVIRPLSEVKAETEES